MRRVWGTICALACAVAAGAADIKTPENSKLFVRHEDPQTGVVSYLLEPGRAAFNQQSLYFTAKSMTDDGRFLVFWASDDEFPPDRRGVRVHVPKRLALVDLAKEEIVDLKAGGTIPWIDVKTDQMWYVDAAGVHRRDFLVDPLKDNLLCPWPAALTATKPGTKTAHGTHPTLSPDRRYVFLDVRVDNRYRQGVIDTETGAWTEWTQTDFYCNHGQFSPVDPTLALCAWERARFKAPGELYPDERARATFDATGWVSDVLRAPDDVYPRLWLFREGRNWEVTSKITNYATHEYFAEDGKGFYWCSAGVVYHDLATGRQWRIGPIGMAHATMTADNRYLVGDESWGGWWRGCGWTVRFWNRATHRGVYIHSKRPRIAAKENESGLHPDPHPQFVCGGRYIVCTMNDEARRMNVSVTPVAPLVARTSDPATAPQPKTFPLAFDPAARTDATYELQIDVDALRRKNLVAPPPCTAPGDSYTAFALKGIVDGHERMLPFEAVQGSDYRKNVVLRFKIPAGTERLFYVADAPGRFEYYDSESCANLFAGAYEHANAARWTPGPGATCAPHRAGLAFAAAAPSTVSYEAPLPPEARGRDFKFELDLRNLGTADWTGGLKLVPLDASGAPLGDDALAGQGAGKPVARDRRGVYRLTGTFPPAARRVRLEIGLVTRDGSPARVLVCRLNLREATVFAFKPGDAEDAGYDVVVAGGTSYGVAAAVEAAKGGARVCLVAPRAALGEDLAGTLRLKPSDGAALPADLRARLYAANSAARNSFGGATPLQIKKALDAALIEAGVTFRCWTQPCEIAAGDDGAVTGLWVAGRDGRRLVRAKTVIDATPLAGLARRAGVLPPLPGGAYTVVRHVVSGTRPEAEGLTATAASEAERIPLTEKQPQLRPAPDLPDFIDARLWRCERTCTLADGSARSFARLEQEMRDATWTRDQVDAGDFCFFAQLPAGCDRAHRITRVPPRAAPPAPTLAEVDVLVVGGGTAGAPAAIAAARKGMKTLCIEYAGKLGGVMTEGAIGLYCFGLRRGFTAELDAALKTMGGVYGVCKAEWFRAEARKAGAEIWLCAQATGAVTEGGRVVGATVALADGTYGVVRAKAVIDATGYALLAASAGERTEFLSADEISVQGAGSTPRLLGRSYQNTDALFVDDTDPADISYEWLRARTSFGPHVWDQAAVVNSRERRRMHGAYYVTVQDAMGGRNYPDLIGVTHSNFDTHGQTVDPQFFVEDPGHKGRSVNLPYRALLPAKVDGLLVTGLGMSAHRDAMPILRMQPDVQNQGYTAGLAAAQAVRTGVALRAIDVKELQRELVGKGILRAEELAAPEGFPLSDGELAAAVDALGKDYRDLAKVLSDRARARPLLEWAYAAAADAGAKRVYAHVLGLVGSASGWKELVAALDGVSAWDAGWNFRGMHQFGRSVSWMDSYLIALGTGGRALKGNAAVIEAVRRKAALLTGENRYSHFRAVAKAAEGIGDPALAPDLARLLALPKVGGHALAPRAVPPIAGYEQDISHLGVADQERSDCLRELSVARALFRLGDPTGAARKTLEAYAADPRRVYAAHARAVLSGRLSD